MAHEISPGARVELLPDRERVYRFARAGSKGIVVDEREDEYGYSMVYIEWDPEVQEPDCWTFASHFRLLEGAGQPSAHEMIRRAEESRPHCPTCGQLHEPETDRYAKHLDILSVATEAASTADGYMVITMEKKVDDQGNQILTPKVFFSNLTPLASTVVEEQVVKMAHMYHRERIEAALADAIRRETNGR